MSSASLGQNADLDQAANAQAGSAPIAESEADERFLSITQLTKRFGDVAAVNAVSVDIARGEIFALLGSSGCGKSTLLRMLAGFETPSEGGIRLAGQDIARMPPYQRPINMMFQSYALFPHLSVWDNVAFGLKRQRHPKDEIAQRVEQMLGLVQLTPYAKRKPHQLSGGQQQRVALARSLSLKPQLLLLDEPLGALDRKLREQTQFELHSIIKKVGVTCVMVTHDQEEAMTMADRIAVMSQGEFLQVGTPAAIYESPNCRFVADFLGNVNLFSATLERDARGDQVAVGPEAQFAVPHTLEIAVGAPVWVALRPEKIHLSLEHPAKSAPYLQGTILDRAYFGDSSLYRVTLATGMQIKVHVPSTTAHGAALPVDTKVFATWAPEAPVFLVR